MHRMTIGVGVAFGIGGGVLGAGLDMEVDVPGSRGLWIGTGVFLGAGVGIMVGGLLRRQVVRAFARKVEAVNSWAERLGLTAMTSSRLTATARVEPFNRRGTHAIVAGWSGRHRDRDVEVYHYAVDTGTARHPQSRLYTVIASASRGAADVIEVLPRRGMPAWAASAGRWSRDIEPSAFAREWRVRADDAQVAREVLTPQVVQRLADAPRDGTVFAWDGPAVIAVGPGRRVDTGELATWLEWVTDVARFGPGVTRPDAATMAVPVAASASASRPWGPTARPSAPAPSSALETPGSQDGGARPVSPRVSRKHMSGLELLLLVAALGAIYGGVQVWNRVAPLPGLVLLVLGIGVGFTSGRIHAALQRIRRRRR